jgi:manganese efflux pump family protein
VKLLLFVLPLGLDTFAVSAALGVRGMPRRERLRISFLFAGFEAAMPIVGLLLGRAAGYAVGDAAEFVAIAVLALLGLWMVVHEEGSEAADLPRASFLAAVALGLSISLDELAIGFTIGLLGLSLWRAAVLLGVQAFVFSQLGLRLGSRLGESQRERAEQLAGLALLALAAWLAAGKLG